MVQAALLPLAFAIVIFPVDWVVAVIFLVTAPLIPVFMALVGWGAEAREPQPGGGSSTGSAPLRRPAAWTDDAEAVRRSRTRDRRRAHCLRRAARPHHARAAHRLSSASAVLEFFAALGIAGVALYIGLTLLDLRPLRGGAELTLAAGMFCPLDGAWRSTSRCASSPRTITTGAAGQGRASLSCKSELETLPELDMHEPALPPAVTVHPAPPASRSPALSVRRPPGTVVLERVDLTARTR